MKENKRSKVNDIYMKNKVEKVNETLMECSHQKCELKCVLHVRADSIELYCVVSYCVVLCRVVFYTGCETVKRKQKNSTYIQTVQSTIICDSKFVLTLKLCYSDIVPVCIIVYYITS